LKEVSALAIIRRIDFPASEAFIENPQRVRRWCGVAVRAHSGGETVGESTSAHHECHQERRCGDDQQKHDERDEGAERTPWAELSGTKGAKSNHSPRTGAVNRNS
jgi:hypothetical protein